MTCSRFIRTAYTAALAGEIVARPTQEFPGMTHAMVQGEFTLAHALVRRLHVRDVTCLAATTRREVIESALSEGFSDRSPCLVRNSCGRDTRRRKLCLEPCRRICLGRDFGVLLL
jgi:hypothetical protein